MSKKLRQKYVEKLEQKLSDKNDPKARPRLKPKRHVYFGVKLFAHKKTRREEKKKEERRTTKFPEQNAKTTEQDTDLRTVHTSNKRFLTRQGF